MDYLSVIQIKYISCLILTFIYTVYASSKYLHKISCIIKNKSNSCRSKCWESYFIIGNKRNTIIEKY